jgi:hypothetical protein
MSALLFRASENVNFTLKGLGIIGGYGRKKIYHARVRAVARVRVVAQKYRFSFFCFLLYLISSVRAIY